MSAQPHFSQGTRTVDLTDLPNTSPWVWQVRYKLVIQDENFWAWWTCHMSHRVKDMLKPGKDWVRTSHLVKSGTNKTNYLCHCIFWANFRVQIVYIIVCGFVLSVATTHHNSQFTSILDSWPHLMPSENWHDTGRAELRQITALYTPQYGSKVSFPLTGIESNISTSRCIINHR